MSLQDAYKSIYEALAHAGFSHQTHVDIVRIDSELLTRNHPEEELGHLSGILIPGGFGERGISGKIDAIKYARENHIPFFGICLGLQCAVIEFARNVCGLKGANSIEFNNKTEHPVISLMAEQKEKHKKGGTMRLGAYPCALTQGSLAWQLYQKNTVSERHRHRYELDNQYKSLFASHGFHLSGLN